MSNPATTRHPAATLAVAVFVALLTAGLSGAVAVPARADNGEHQNRRWDDREQERARRHGWQQERWQQEHRYDGYYRRPDPYYSAPPVVQLPPSYYYQQPGPSLNFSFPLFR